MIYFIQDTSSRAIKIGTSKRPLARLSDLQTAHHSPLILIGVMEGSQYEEQALHKKFERLQGEWFEPSRALLAYIQNNAITPQSMGHVGALEMVGPKPKSNSTLVERVCEIRDIFMLITMWIATVVSFALFMAVFWIMWRTGDWSHIGWAALAMCEAMAFAFLSTLDKKRLLKTSG